MRTERLKSRSHPLLVLALLVLSLNAAAAVKNSEKCQLIFGWDLVKPYQYFDSGGRVVGLQIDLIKAITQEMDCHLIFQESKWDALMAQLKEGEVDFIADATVVESRKQFGLFSAPYRVETYTLYVAADKLDAYHHQPFKSLMDNGFRLGLTKGYIYSTEIEGYRQDTRYKSQFTETDYNSDNYQRLLSGEIDGFLEDSMIAGYTLREMQISHLVKALPFELHTGEIAFLFSKKTVSRELIQRFNQAMEKVKRTKAYRQAWIKPTN